jgi:hypothetical protein
MQEKFNFSEFNLQGWLIFLFFVTFYTVFFFNIFVYPVLKIHLGKSKFILKFEEIKQVIFLKITIYATPIKLYLSHYYVKYFYKNLPITLRKRYFNLVYYVLKLRVRLFNDSTILFITLFFLIGWGLYLSSAKLIIFGFVCLILPIIVAYDNWVRLGKIYDIRVEKIIQNEYCPRSICIISDGVIHHILNFDDVKIITGLPNNGVFATIKVRGYAVDIRHNRKVYSQTKIFEIVR